MAIPKLTSRSPHIPSKDPNIIHGSDDDSDGSGVDVTGDDFENVISKVDVSDLGSNNNSPYNNPISAWLSMMTLQLMTLQSMTADLL
jgi:hypothetical protein